MLRRPSFYYHTPRGEGCSSTAFGNGPVATSKVWNNSASRGSFDVATGPLPAVP
jgi:hypothetical protein